MTITSLLEKRAYATRNERRHDVVAGLLAVGLLASACTSDGADPGGSPVSEWSLHEEGSFTASTPPGWDLEAGTDGRVTFSGPDDAGATVLPFFVYGSQLTAEAGAAALAQVAPELVEAEWETPSALDDETIRATSADGRSVAILTYTNSARGAAGVVYAAHSSDLASQEDTFARIFSSFAPVGASVEGDGGPSYQSFTDPTEGAFTTELPEGWTTEGGIARPCPTLTQGNVQALSPDNDQFIKLGNDYPWFTEPAPQFGLPEGSTYPHPCGYQSPVVRYLPGAQFMTDYLLPAYANAEVIEVRDRPDVAASLGAVGFQSFDAGEVEYRHTSDGVVIHGVALVVTERLQTDIGGAWDVWRIVQAEATEEHYADAVGHALHMAETFRIDERWALGQAEMTRQQSQIIADLNDSISNTISEGYWGRQATYDAIAERRSDATLEVEDFVDPVTGDFFELESGSEYYWIDPAGTIIGTDVSVAPTIDFRELLQLP